MLHGAVSCTYIWVIFGVHVGKYSIHGASGCTNAMGNLCHSEITGGHTERMCFFTEAPKVLCPSGNKFPQLILGVPS